MSLVDCQPSYHTFTRSLTFPKTRNFVAQERVTQISGHLARSNTAASDRSDKQEMANDTAPASAQTGGREAPADPKLNKQVRCPECMNWTKEQPKKDTNIDGDVPDVKNQLIPPPSPPLKQHRDFVHCLPPEAPTYRKISLFTAGSIEMGNAVQWQSRLVDHLQDLPITVTNPRRGHWDSKIDAKARDAAFAHQVKWELDALHEATVICFFFDTMTRSPVTLLELGLWAHSHKVIVCCANDYWRQGNVEIVCKRYKIPFVRTFEAFVPAVREMLVRKGLTLTANGDFDGDNSRPPKLDEDKKAELAEEEWWDKY